MRGWRRPRERPCCPRPRRAAQRVACLGGGVGAPDVDRVAQGLLDLVRQVWSRDRHGDLVGLGVAHESDVAADERRDDDQADQERLQPDTDGMAAPVTSLPRRCSAKTGLLSRPAISRCSADVALSAFMTAVPSCASRLSAQGRQARGLRWRSVLPGWCRTGRRGCSREARQDGQAPTAAGVRRAPWCRGALRSARPGPWRGRPAGPRCRRQGAWCLGEESCGFLRWWGWARGRSAALEVDGGPGLLCLEGLDG